MTTTAASLQSAIALHRAGRLDEAERAYRDVIRREPNHTQAHNDLGVLLAGRKRWDEAAECFRKVLALRPNDAAAHNNLGNVLNELGRPAEAVESFQAAVRIRPDMVAAYNNLANALHNLGRADEAMAQYRQALEIAPQYVEASYNLALILKEQGRFDEAIGQFRAAVQMRPDFVEAECNLGNTLREQGQLSEALAHLQRAVTLRPDLAAAQSNLGATLHALGKLDEAQARFERALELEPDRAEFLLNMGNVLKDQARVAEAIAWFERSLAAQPGFAQALCGRGVALLSLGNFVEGFAGYEHRLGCAQFNTLRLPQPQWDGSPLDGRRLLIHTEQGLGDTLHFIRYVSLVLKRETDVTIAARAALVPLLAISGYGPLVSTKEPLPPYDVQVPLMSLPHVLGTRLDSVPAEVPYLKADPARVERWGRELAKYPGFKVGIAWQGRPDYRGDRLRSIPLVQFAPLAHLEGVRLFSLQKGPGAEQVAALAGRFELVDLGPVVDNHCGAFMDTSAVIEHLDLVISSDTAVAHLAGALGMPVWVALSFAPEWRWMQNRDDSPWYPTMRLFRQTELGRWEDVFERMAEQLRARPPASTNPGW